MSLIQAAGRVPEEPEGTEGTGATSNGSLKVHPDTLMWF